MPRKLAAEVARQMDADLRIPPVSQERARRCVEAASLRARKWSYRRIAEHYGWSSPAAAHKAVQIGLALVPSADLQEVRRLAAMELDEIGRGLWEVIASPGPLVSQGQIIYAQDADGTKTAFPDRMVQVRAYEALLKTNAEFRKMFGADAPKRTLSMLASIPPEEIMAEIARLKAQAGGGDELPDLGDGAAAEVLTGETDGWDVAEDPGEDTPT